MAAEDDLRELENRRIKAACTRDRALMETIFDASMTYIHMNGLVENKQQLIDGIMKNNRFNKIERPDLQIRIHGDTAVLTGPMHVWMTTDAGEERNPKGQVTEVAIKRADGWRFVAYQATRDTTGK
jgi:ketosteroid isomerase-like protein